MSVRTIDERLEGRIETRNKMPVDLAPFTSRADAWAPTDASGAALAIAFTDARYVKLGSLVICFFFATYPATASGAVAKIGGLPFVPHTTVNNAQPVLFSDTSAAIVRGYIVPGTKTFRFRDSTGVADALNSGMSTKTVGGIVVYETDE